MTTNDIVKAAWTRKEPENMDFMEQKLYWAMRSICFLYTYGELSKEAATEAKESLIDSYEKQRPDWIKWSRCQEAHRLLATSSNAEVRRIASEVEKMFEE